MLHPWGRNNTLRPSLELDFANTSSLDSRITFTRASSATFFNSLGVLTTANNDVPRLTYNPSTLAAQGLLIEEQRTNLLLRSQEFGTSWIRFGTTTLTENTSVAPDGTTTGDNIVFTSASAGIYQIVTGAALTTYTFSVWIKSSSSTQVRIVINTNLSDPTVQSVAVTSGWQRVSISKTTAVGTTSVTAQIQDDGSGNTQFDIWGAQLEAGAFATSYIPTTTTALTRNADVASMTGTNFSSWYNQTEGSFVVNASVVSNSGSRVFMDVGPNGAFGTTAYVVQGSTSISLAPAAAPVNMASSANTALLTNKVAIGLAANNAIIAVNGTLGTVDSSCAMPASSTQLVLGHAIWASNGTQLNGTIARLAYYPVRLSNAQLQALTS